ncbi:hypothetical protein C8Q79DRAFT_292036 [Trametes meyenii]|nr:hypothetical protein C8Q79DRAFT_292036 [Trametes meyenii]
MSRSIHRQMSRAHADVDVEHGQTSGPHDYYAISSLFVNATRVAGMGMVEVEPHRAGLRESCRMVVEASWMNALLLVIPLAWISHWLADGWGHEVTFILCFVSIVPLQNIFDWCGDQLARRTGRDTGDFISISLKNCVEATLAILLLAKCELRLLQSTIIVVILHLLLVPGVAFFIQGSKTFQQILHPHHTAVNPSLLMTGVLAIMLPTAFFAALDRGNDTSPAASSEDAPFSPLVSDLVRSDLLKMSRGMSVMLILIYTASRIYRHVPWPLAFSWPQWPVAVSWWPPRVSRKEGQHVHLHKRIPIRASMKAPGLEPLVNLTVCLLLIFISVGVMAVTAEFLVESIDPIRERSNIQAEWFGLVLLPLVSFSPEAAIAIYCFTFPQERYEYGSLLRAHGRPIDLSIQFTLFWMPLLVLLAWWADKPLHLLFDYFEVSLLLGACFLVNYVTADGKTNFAEGMALLTLYAMIATASWFYPGQPQVGFLLTCPGSVVEGVAEGPESALALL